MIKVDPNNDSAVKAGQREIIIRPTVQEDLDYVLQEEAKPENARFVDQWCLAEHSAALADENVGHFILEELSEHERKRVGYVILVGMSNADDSVQFRRIVVSEKGKGVGQTAVKLIKDMVFSKLGMHRLWLNVKEGNPTAQRLYSDEGFVKEGVSRECSKSADGRYSSFIVMSMLESEYEDYLKSSRTC